MSGSKKARLRQTKRFEQTFEEVKNRHLSGKAQTKIREKFEQRTVDIVKALLDDPTSHPEEPYPDTTDLKGWQFRKIRYDIADLKRPERKCRIMYFYHPIENTVVLAWAYTHAEFEGRPSDTEIEKAFVEVKE